MLLGNILLTPPVALITMYPNMYNLHFGLLGFFLTMIGDKKHSNLTVRFNLSVIVCTSISKSIFIIKLHFYNLIFKKFETDIYIYQAVNSLSFLNHCN